MEQSHTSTNIPTCVDDLVKEFEALSDDPRESYYRGDLAVRFLKSYYAGEKITVVGYQRANGSKKQEIFRVQT